MILETERLIVRNLTMSDLEDSFEHRGDPDVSRFIGKPLTREQAKEKLQQSILPWNRQENSKLMLAIELKDEQKLIGELMFKFTNVDSQIGEIGYRINKNYQAKGYAFEASASFINYLFKQVNVHKVSALCLTDNEASWGLMEKLGMKKEGTLKSHFKVNEQWHDAYIYSVLEEQRK